MKLQDMIMKQLLQQFDANELAYSHRMEVVTAISGWAAQWIAGGDESIEDLYLAWGAEAAALGLIMPDMEDMADSLSDVKSVYEFFSCALLGYPAPEPRVVYAKEGSLVTIV